MDAGIADICVPSFVVDPLEKVAWLTLEGAAHRIQRRQTDSLGSTVLEYCDVGRRDAHPIGELLDTHLLTRKLHIDPTDNGHRSDNRIHLDLELRRSDEQASEDDDQQDDRESNHETEQLS